MGLVGLFLVACPKPKASLQLDHSSVIIELPARDIAGQVQLSCKIKATGAKHLPVVLNINNDSAQTIVVAPQIEHAPRTIVELDGTVTILYGRYDAHQPTDPTQDLVLGPGDQHDVRSAIHLSRVGDDVRARGAGTNLGSPQPWRCGLQYRLEATPGGHLATTEPVRLSFGLMPPPESSDQ